MIDAANKYGLVGLKVSVENVLIQELILDSSNVAECLLFADAMPCPFTTTSRNNIYSERNHGGTRQYSCRITRQYQPDRRMSRLFISDADIRSAPKSFIMTREVLVAAAFHYCDCVRARKAGVYDVVRVLMEAGGANGLEERLLPLQPDQYEQKRQSQQQNLVWLPPISNEKPPKEDDTAIVVTKTTVHR